LGVADAEGWSRRVSAGSRMPPQACGLRTFRLVDALFAVIANALLD
jgi:hypothetical protein